MKSKGAEWFWRSGSRVCKSSALVYVTQVIHDQKVLTAAKDQKTPPRSEGFDVHGLQQRITTKKLACLYGESRRESSKLL